MSHKFEVVVFGGGPAGCVAALQLARSGCSVAVVDKAQPQRPCVGETLPPQSSRLLADLNLLEYFMALGPLPSRGTASVWGSNEPGTNDFIFYPHGNGWHIDRLKFNQMLARAGRQAGATFFAGTTTRTCVDDGDGWHVVVSSKTSEQHLRCRLVIDATGRASTCRFGFPRRTVFDRLIGAAGLARAKQDRVPSDYTLVEAVDAGWFYSALLPSGDYMLVYMTDADLYSAGRAASPSFIKDQLTKAPFTCERIEAIPTSIVAYPALTSIRESVVRPNWLAIGDAARSYDPVCGLGVTSAMRTATRAAQTALRLLDCDTAGMADYEDDNRRAFAEYRSMHHAYYSAERRWPDSHFWRRRHEQAPEPLVG